MVTKKYQSTKAKPAREKLSSPQKSNTDKNLQVCGRCHKVGYAEKQQCTAKEATYIYAINVTKWSLSECLPAIYKIKDLLTQESGLCNHITDTAKALNSISYFSQM